jgi:hypothetical protein
MWVWCEVSADGSLLFQAQFGYWQFTGKFGVPTGARPFVPKGRSRVLTLLGVPRAIHNLPEGTYNFLEATHNFPEVIE